MRQRKLHPLLSNRFVKATALPPLAHRGHDVRALLSA